VSETHCNTLRPIFFILRRGLETAGRMPTLKHIVLIAPKAGGSSSVALLCLHWHQVADEYSGNPLGLVPTLIIGSISSTQLMAIQQPDAEDGARDDSLAYILARF
jgi:hypothetical protein